MHRVELKGSSLIWAIEVRMPFLMHRVELKVSFPVFLVLLPEFSLVPNAPCGVERISGLDFTK